ncbi:MAG: FAD-dependent oxidoreductase [Bacteroidales bacterium]|nr:FAD-dependent oxidoreductase [Bacteroidales bacterium]
MNPEAARCLLCKKPFCSLKGCPVQTPVPQAMALYREGRLEEAGELLFDNNPLSAITSRVCDWKQFCLGHCVLNAKQQPVRWYEIEQEISAAYLMGKPSLKAAGTRLSGKKAAIVGAGPAGLAAAISLHAQGAAVCIYDKQPRMGGVLRYGIPSFRLDRCYIDALEEIILSAGIDFKGGTAIGKELSIKQLSESYDIVFLAAGAEKPATLRIPGEEAAIQALPFLENPGSFDIGRKVIVIGGGNVAMDACRTAARLGADTWVYYRKTFENMPANPLEVEEAKADGVQFAVFQAPVELREGGVVFCDTENVVPEDGGRVVTRILEGTEHFVPCDSLITAISEKPDFSLLEGLPVKMNDSRWPEVGEDGRLCTNVWTAGDFLLGPRSVVEAVASARKATDSIIGNV